MKPAVIGLYKSGATVTEISNAFLISTREVEKIICEYMTWIFLVKIKIISYENNKEDQEIERKEAMN